MTLDQIEFFESAQCLVPDVSQSMNLLFCQCVYSSIYSSVNMFSCQSDPQSSCSCTSIFLARCPTAQVFMPPCVQLPMSSSTGMSAHGISIIGCVRLSVLAHVLTYSMPESRKCAQLDRCSCANVYNCWYIQHGWSCRR